MTYFWYSEYQARLAQKDGDQLNRCILPILGENVGVEYTMCHTTELCERINHKPCEHTHEYELKKLPDLVLLGIGTSGSISFIGDKPSLRRIFGEESY